MSLNAAAPIATQEQYRSALLAVRDRMKDIHLKMLQAHCKSAEHSISLNQLAETCGVTSGTSATTAYAAYARWIAEELKFMPANAPRKQSWLLALAFGRTEDGKMDADDEWVMRPELVAALKAMRWA